VTKEVAEFLLVDAPYSIEFRRGISASSNDEIVEQKRPTTVFRERLPHFYTMCHREGTARFGCAAMTIRAPLHAARAAESMKEIFARPNPQNTNSRPP
jgi:hypothetical protein